MNTISTSKSALQPWVYNCTIMQQSVLMSAIRGMDGLAKRHRAKNLIKFYRRCLLLSAFDKAPIMNAYDEGGGDFTGPSLSLEKDGKQIWGEDFPDQFFFTSKGKVPVEDWWQAMNDVVNHFIRSRDEMPLHYYTHAMHAFHIMGSYHDSDQHRLFWAKVYERMVDALHLRPESFDDMQRRLSDDPAEWRARSDEAGSCQT